MSLIDNCSQTPAMEESQLKQGVEEKHTDRRYVHGKAGNGHTLQRLEYGNRKPSIILAILAETEQASLGERSKG